MFNKPKVAIVYLVWSDEPQKYLQLALRGVAEQTYSKENLELLIVYNSHKKEEPSAAPFIRRCVDLYANVLPHTTILEQEENLGFAGGNNVGMQWAIENKFDYVFLNNADGFLHSDAIEKLVSVMEADKSVGQIQPLILLYPEQDLINSAGNAWHYLGMGYCNLERKPVAEYKFPATQEIDYASGAATMFRTDLLTRYGAWKEEFFLYHEDTEYSLRLRFLGYKIVMAGNAIFYHQYDFERSITKLYWMERNRHVLKLLFYKWPTLFLLLPLEVVYNFGLLITALRGGWIKEILKVYTYWANPLNWIKWLKYRNEIQKTRKITDGELLEHTVLTVDSGEEFVGRPMHRLANTIFTIYGSLLKILVKW
ncbi:MAG: glycosyltransferase family 2 protein [Patescibacteria group bacterium]|nr:glycosyltransferase family 2 protein [Patescibacteria group bacterium]